METTENLSALELALIGLIAGSPSSGYEIRKIFEETPIRHFSSSPGAIYPALRRLEAMDLLLGEVEKQETLRPRKVYQITENGERVLREHLSRPLTRDDVVCRLDELILRFGLIGSICDLDTSLRFLQQLAEQSESYIQELEKQFAERQEQSPPHSRLAHQYGVEIYRSTALWARRAIRELQASKGIRVGEQS